MKALVIEDDAALNEIVCTCLAGAGHTCVPAFSGSEARMLLEGPSCQTFDLVITDLMLPGCPGEDLVPLVRQRLGNVPVIVISAKSAVDDRIALLRCGADDYLVKPFDLDELLARIDAQFRVRGIAAAGSPGAPAAREVEETALTFGAWRLDPATRRFYAADVPVRLTRTEFDLLALLMAHPDRVFTKRDLYLATCHDERLLDDIAAGSVRVSSSDEKTVATHMGNLRAKLKSSGTDGYLETVWGIGFKLRRP